MSSMFWACNGSFGPTPLPFAPVFLETVALFFFVAVYCDRLRKTCSSILKRAKMFPGAKWPLVWTQLLQPSGLNLSEILVCSSGLPGCSCVRFAQMLHFMVHSMAVLKRHAFCKAWSVDDPTYFGTVVHWCHRVQVTWWSLLCKS